MNKSQPLKAVLGMAASAVLGGAALIAADAVINSRSAERFRTDRVEQYLQTKTAIFDLETRRNSIHSWDVEDRYGALPEERRQGIAEIDSNLIASLNSEIEVNKRNLESLRTNHGAEIADFERASEKDGYFTILVGGIPVAVFGVGAFFSLRRYGLA